MSPSTIFGTVLLRLFLSCHWEVLWCNTTQILIQSHILTPGQPVFFLSSYVERQTGKPEKCQFLQLWFFATSGLNPKRPFPEADAIPTELTGLVLKLFWTKTIPWVEWRKLHPWWYDEGNCTKYVWVQRLPPYPLNFSAEITRFQLCALIKPPK